MVSEMLQIESEPLYHWGHVQTAINIKRPIRVNVILGSWETEKFKHKTVPRSKMTDARLYFMHMTLNLLSLS